MKPTTFNNAVVSVISAYAEALQELVAENNQLKDKLRVYGTVGAVPDGEVLVPKKQYEQLRAALVSIGDGYAERVEKAARELIFTTENP